MTSNTLLQQALQRTVAEIRGLTREERKARLIASEETCFAKAINEAYEFYKLCSSDLSHQFSFGLVIIKNNVVNDSRLNQGVLKNREEISGSYLSDSDEVYEMAA